ncbi:uncharacterized protein BX663DRAFT_543690 [Cokeromyces recurvatus]|uniref:uncharacterized protein n=1 Tax=Cokeromyces recurvatus TaxID=90255 RepID=UPI00221F3AAE|nr:uncharacterized protein BX663DRAFT_543690 [Cokeromyces recurvatus]KAI7902246.1 hypothetical protein BX663DRAFT_543690 [Cokeromyces recurvatus]
MKMGHCRRLAGMSRDHHNGGGGLSFEDGGAIIVIPYRLSYQELQIYEGLVLAESAILRHQRPLEASCCCFHFQNRLCCFCYVDTFLDGFLGTKVVQPFNLRSFKAIEIKQSIHVLQHDKRRMSVATVIRDKRIPSSWGLQYMDGNAYPSLRL